MTMFAESLRAFLKPVVPYLDDDSVTEIMINGPTDIWIEKHGRLIRTDAKFSEEGLLGAARNMAQFVGRPLSDERPTLDARLPDGSRIHVVLPPISRKGATIAIRKFFKDKPGIETLIEYKTLTPEMAQLIRAAIELKHNIIVSGGTSSGKTTLLNIFSSLIPEHERIVTIEDSAELQLEKEHLVSLETRAADKYGKGEVTMTDLLHSSLRLRPDRIILGEVRGGECFDLVQAMNTGHGGSLSSCHANNPIDTLRRLESLCLMSKVDLPMVAVRSQIASAIGLVVVCTRMSDGSRKVTAISEVLPLNEKGEYRTQDLFVYTQLGKDSTGTMLGYHAPTGLIPTFAPLARTLGHAELDDEFFDPATYGLPAPPLVHLGEDYTVKWAPSLSHRTEGLADPQELTDALHAFERKVKADAKLALDERTPPLGAEANSPTVVGAPTVTRVNPQGRATNVEGDPGERVTDPGRSQRTTTAKELQGPITDEEKVQVSDELFSDARQQNTQVRTYPAKALRPAAPQQRPSGTTSPPTERKSDDEKTRIKPMGDKVRR